MLGPEGSCPLGAGEEWGQRWDFHRLVENHDLDYVRATLPNVGGITEMLKIAALCETHDIGIVPHFTGPIATAALVHALGPFPGPVTVEYNYGATKPGSGQVSHLNEFLTFREIKAVTVVPAGVGRRLHLVDPGVGELVPEHAGVPPGADAALT